MVSQTSLCLCSALFVLFISSSLAYNNFDVGGKEGWVINPSESYNHWARKNRFQVNDTLVFKYEKGSDSVFQVSKGDYHRCNNEKPIKRMTSGESVFQFDYSGSFYFISGKEAHCHKGQKLHVVVLAVRPSPAYPPTTPPPASQPPSAMPPKAPSPATPAPSPQSPSPWSKPPAPSPTTPPAPWTKAPVPAPKAPAPWSPAPKAPAPWSPAPKAPAPWSPALAPAPKATWPQPPSPHALTPIVSPSPSPQPAPIISPSPEVQNSPSPSPNGKDADIAPAPAPSHSWVPTPSCLFTLLAVILISLVMGVSP